MKSVIGIKFPEGTGSQNTTSIVVGAGPDRTLQSGQSLTLAASTAIMDAFGPTTYTWSRLSGVGGSLSDPNILRPVFTAPIVTSDRTITLRLTVTNNEISNSDDVVITVTTSTTTTTDIDNIFRRDANVPPAPLGGTNTEDHTPTGWRRDRPQATAVEGVYRAQRTLTYMDGVFTSATPWGNVTLIQAPLGSLLDAVAPTVTIAPVGSVDEDNTQALSVSISGGTYDFLGYAWEVISGGGSISGSGDSVTYTPDNVISDTLVTVRCTVTAFGNGTTVIVGDTDIASDDEEFTVNVIGTGLPNATVPTMFSIEEITELDSGNTYSIFTTDAGDGISDGNSYVWEVISGGGSIVDSGSPGVAHYTTPDVSVETTVVIRCTLTVIGTGGFAADGTSDSVSDDEEITITPAAEPPGVPTSVSFVLDGITYTMMWGHPTTGGTPDEYRYQSQINGNLWCCDVITSYPGTSRSFNSDTGTITGARLRAENPGGMSAWVEVFL